MLLPVMYDFMADKLGPNTHFETEQLKSLISDSTDLELGSSFDDHFPDSLQACYIFEVPPTHTHTHFAFFPSPLVPFTPPSPPSPQAYQVLNELQK